jgi:hypothetical protein
MDKAETKERKQKTKTGYEIPLPKRTDFFRNLTKAAKSDLPPARERRVKPKD